MTKEQKEAIAFGVVIGFYFGAAIFLLLYLYTASMHIAFFGLGILICALVVHEIVYKQLKKSQLN